MYDDYDFGGGRRSRAGWLWSVVAVAAVAGLLGAAYFLGGLSTAHPTYTQAAAPPAVSAPGPDPASPPSDDTLPTPASAQPAPDPVTSAVAWLQTYWARSYTDPSASTWVDRILPVVDTAVAKEYQGYRDGTAGAAWSQFVSARCTTAVKHAGGVIPAEAPKTASTVSVQVTGTLEGTCLDGTAPAQGQGQAVNATLQMTKGTDGLWRVGRHLY